jgi:hypothetical protein
MQVATEQTTSSGLSSAGVFSFSDIMPSQSQSPNSNSRGFLLEGAGSPLFLSKEAVEKDNSPEKEAYIDLKPIVTLPESDDADVLFKRRSKLSYLDSGSNQWKERGVGDIKILKHKKTGKVRVIMRRDDQIFCDHYITEDMKLSPGPNNPEKSWVWITNEDCSGGEPKKEKLSVKFKDVETAKEFQHVFDNSVTLKGSDDDPKQPGSVTHLDSEQH